MRLTAPLRFDDDTTDLDDAVIVQCITEVINSGGIIFVGFTLGMLVVESGKLLIIIHNAVSGGFHQPLALSIERLHLGVDGTIRTGILFASHKGKSEQSQEQNT